MKSKSLHGSCGLWWLGVVIALSLPACLVPPFSELQDARLVGQGRIEMTPFASTISAEGQTNHVQNDFGVQAGVGVLSFMDFRFRYEYLYHPDSGDAYDESYGAHVLAVGPKFSLVKNILALYLPIGFGFGEDVKISETWQFHPTLIATAPLAKGFTLSVSAKALIPLYSGGNTLYAVNLGMGIAPNAGPVTLRPEAGILFDTKGSGIYFHLSFGLSFRFGR